jgi:hypothetical protein
MPAAALEPALFLEVGNVARTARRAHHFAIWPPHRHHELLADVVTGKALNRYL